MTDPSTEVPESPPLSRLVGRGLGWSLLSQVLNRVAIFGSGVVLARLLTPEDFGVYALALVAIAVLGAINELGTMPAIVWWKGDVREAAGTGVAMATATSLALFGLTWVAAPGFAEALGSPDATAAVRLMAVTIVIDGLSSASQALLHRDIAQLRQALAETAGTVAYVVLAVVLAVADLGPMSIVWGRVLGSAVTGVLFVLLAPFVPKPRLSVPVARTMLRFGLPLAMSALVAEAVLSVDYLVVGQALGAATLGIYLLAFNLSNWPVSIVSMAVQRVAFAGLVRLLADRGAFSGAFARAFGVAITATVPMILLLAVLAPELVGIVYGDRWLPAVTAVRFLLVLGGLRVLLDLLFDLVAADGRSGLTFQVRLAWLLVLTPALLVGVEVDGIRGVGIAHMVVALALVTPLLLLAARRTGLELSGLARQLPRPLLSGAAAFAAMMVVSTALEGRLTRLVLLGLVGSLVYAATIVPGNPLVGWVLTRLGVKGSATR